MVDHLQSRVTPWRQYTSHVKVWGTLSKMDVCRITIFLGGKFTMPAGFGRNMNGDILRQPRNFFNIATELLMQETQVG